MSKGASLRDRACAPDGAEPAAQSQAEPLVPSALSRQLSGRARYLEDLGEVKTPSLLREAAGRIDDLGLALSWALGVLSHYEPGDSRAVSDEFVSAAAIEADLWELDSARACLAQAIEARRAETQSGSVHESAVHEVDAPISSSPSPPTPEIPQ